MKKMELTNDEKNIYEHILDHSQSHINLTLKSGGLRMRETYFILLKLIDIGLISRSDNKKFSKQK